MNNLCRHCRFFGGDQLAPGEIGMCTYPDDEHPYTGLMRGGAAQACGVFARWIATAHGELAVPRG